MVGLRSLDASSRRFGNSHPVAGRFVERRKGGETGVKSVQSIRGVETWDWVEKNPWVGKLLESVAAHFDFDAAHFQQQKGATNACIIEYNDGMGGTDLFDFFRGAFTTQRRSRKWWHSLFYFVLDSSAHNGHVIWHTGVGRATGEAVNRKKHTKRKYLKAVVKQGLAELGYEIPGFGGGGGVNIYI